MSKDLVIALNEIDIEKIVRRIISKYSTTKLWTVSNVIEDSNFEVLPNYKDAHRMIIKTVNKMYDNPYRYGVNFKKVGKSSEFNENGKRPMRLFRKVTQ